MTDALTISGLKKSYPDFVLDGVSFSVPRGSIVGLRERGRKKHHHQRRTGSRPSGFEVGLTLSFFSIAVMYPLVLKLGTEKNELILLLSAFGAIGMQLLLAAGLSKWTDGMNMRHPLVEATGTIAAILLFLASYFVSVKIHKSKEF